jgi:transposase
MEVVSTRCAGLDVHRSVIVACALLGETRGRVRKVSGQFPTTRSGLERLLGWLGEFGVSHVGMESTGVYWMPIYAVLEQAGGFKLIVVNAQHAKAIKGRKTDVKDAEWLAELVRHGLVQGSFVPPRPIRQLRDLTRYRRTLVENQASERRRLIKLLEMADIKLAGVISDIFGVSGRAILRALIAGDQTAVAMSQLARGSLRRKRRQLIEALAGELAAHQRQMLALQLVRVEADEADIAALDRQIDEHLAPYAAQRARLMTIPGIDWVVAATIVAEIGVDMSVFPSAGHLAAWAGACPANHESAGKRQPAGARTGNPYLKTALCNAAVAAARKRGSFFKAKYHKLKSRRGGGRAALAIAHKLLVCVYHMLSTSSPYRELGEDYLDRRDTQRAARRYVSRLRDLGFSVLIQPLSAPQPAPANGL